MKTFIEPVFVIRRFFSKTELYYSAEGRWEGLSEALTYTRKQASFANRWRKLSGEVIAIHSAKLGKNRVLNETT